MSAPRVSIMPYRAAAARQVVLVVLAVVAAGPVIADSSADTNKGISNVVVPSSPVAAGAVINVAFDYKIWHSGHTDECPWEIRWDGAAARDGALLASGSKHHNGSGDLTWHVACDITIPVDASRGPHAIKIATAVDAAWAGTVYHNEPVVVGAGLAWAGTVGYEGDGVDPDDGLSRATAFTFRVDYTDVDGEAPASARCEVLRQKDDGTWEHHQWLPMALESGDPVSGAIYAASTQLVRNVYQYRFVFTNVDGDVGGPPALRTAGPVITDRASLAWEGSAGYQTDGVHPHRGAADATAFTFKVRYEDATGLDPTQANLVMERVSGSVWLPFGSFPLAKKSGDVATGAVYSVALTRPNEVMRYHFALVDADGFEVAGPPTQWRNGPLIDATPMLRWTDETGFESDGVEPDAGPLGTRFEFRVLYRDSAGDAPIRMRLKIQKDGVAYRWVGLKAVSAVDYRLGTIYRAYFTPTELGSYTYRFSMWDITGQAAGPPSKFQTGPTVTAATSATVASLTAAPTNTGAQITFALSAPATVEARVLNIAGRPVRTLCTGKQCEAGRSTLLWNALSDQGLPVPGGMYLVEVVARGVDGGETRRLTSLRR